MPKPKPTKRNASKSAGSPANVTEHAPADSRIILRENMAPVVRDAVSTVLYHTQTVRAVADSIMVEDVHYGTIPGTKKPTLYQAGAQALMVTFKLRPRFDVKERELPATIPGGVPHREYSVTTELHDAAGNYIGQGVGLCSSMESKYRYRSGDDFTDTGEPVPSTYWNLANDRDKKRCLATIMDDASGIYGVKKILVAGQGEKWHIVKYPEERAISENPNISDCFNTVLKIAKKRSLVDGVLNATGASDVFAQDLEDLEDNLAAIQAATGIDLDGARTIPADDRPRQRATPQPPEGVKAPPVSQAEWRNTVVHLEGSVVKGRKLGDLNLVQLKALKKKWVDVIDWQAPERTFEDRKLRKGVVAALADNEILGTGGQSAFRTPETPPAASASNSPATGTASPDPAKATPGTTNEPLGGKAEAGGASKPALHPWECPQCGATYQDNPEEHCSRCGANPAPTPPENVDERDETLAAIERILIDRELEEEDILRELDKRELLGPHSGAKTLRDLPGDWLPDILAQLPGFLKEWGYIKD